MTKEQKEAVEAVFNEPVLDCWGKHPRKVCIRCANVQTHAKLNCYYCGQPFESRGDGKPFTVLQVMEFYQMNYSHAKKCSVYYPNYIYAIFKRKLEPKGVTEQAFTEYFSKTINQEVFNKQLKEIQDRK